jgi:hypothetical protein
MLKSSSLCLYSSNLGTFWLKIEQFWSFEEISIFSHGGHLGYRTALTDTILEENHPMTFIKILFLLSKWFQRRRFLWEFPLGSNVKLSSAVAAILVGVLKCRTQFRRGPPKNHFSKVWLRLAQQFQRRIFFLNFIPPFF